MEKTYKVIDSFCGCGGLSKGFELAGFDIVGGVDFDRDVTSTFDSKKLFNEKPNLYEKAYDKVMINDLTIELKCLKKETML